MRSQAERDEQTLDIVSTLLVGLLVLGVPALVVLSVFSAYDLPDAATGGAFAVLFAAYVGFVVVRLRGVGR